MNLRVLGLLSSLSLIQAQSIPTMATGSPPVASPLQVPVGVFESDGGLVALAPGYKAWLRPGDVEFLPVLGARAPHLPLHLRPVAVERGGAVVPLAAGAGERVSPTRASFAVAPGISAVYDSRERGLEQSFVFAERPAGQGDLVVRLELRTAMPLASVDASRLRFVQPGCGEITIDTVVGIDALGHRTAGAMRFDGTTLSLSLPAAFVDAAAYPLTLDPLLGAATQLGPNNSTAQDVVFDATVADYLVVWTVPVSILDSDVYGLRVDGPTGAAIGSAFPIDVLTSLAVGPRVGSVRQTARCLCAFTGGPTGNDVVVRTINLNTTAVSGPVTIATTGSEVAVGSESTTSDDEAVVVWLDGDVKACQVTVGAGVLPVASATVTLATSPIGTNFDQVAISRAANINGVFLVAWTSTFAVSGAAQVIGMAITRNCTPLTVQYTLLGGGVNVRRGAVDGFGQILFGSEFLVAGEQNEVANPASHDIVCARVTYDSSLSALLVSAAQVVTGAVGVDEAYPHVAWTGTRYAVTFTENPGSNLANVGAWFVNRDCTTCSVRMNMVGTNPTTAWTKETDARVCGQAAWGSSDEALVVYTEANPTSGERAVVGQRIEAVGPGGAVTDLGGGCGGGGNANAQPNGLVLGNDNFQFRVTGLQAGALPLCCLAVPAATIPCGSCTFLNPLASYFESPAGGVANHTFAVPCSSVFFGFVLECQWVSLLTTTTPCPLVPGLAASNRVRWIVGP